MGPSKKRRGLPGHACNTLEGPAGTVYGWTGVGLQVPNPIQFLHLTRPASSDPSLSQHTVYLELPSCNFASIQNVRRSLTSPCFPFLSLPLFVFSSYLLLRNILGFVCLVRFPFHDISTNLPRIDEPFPQLLPRHENAQQPRRHARWRAFEASGRVS